MMQSKKKNTGHGYAENEDQFRRRLDSMYQLCNKQNQ